MQTISAEDLKKRIEAGEKLNIIDYVFKKFHPQL